MIIVCGAGSALAQVVIPSLAKSQDVLAISRGHRYEAENITNVNVTEYHDIEEILKKVESADITWVNFVGHSNNSLLFDLSENAIKQDLELNFYLNFRATKTLLPRMVSRGFGRFIFISSSRALKGATGIFSYGLGKLSSLALQEQIVKEYSRFGITANTLSLGFFQTPMWSNIDEKKRKELLQQVPTKKLSDPNCIAPTISLIIDHASINNNTFRLDDGFY